MAMVLLIIGPSGSGKTTLQDRLVNDKTLENIVRSVSATTRPPKRGEVHGQQYYFIDDETFLEWEAQERFYETAEYVDARYGTPRKFIDQQLRQGKDIVAVVEVKGAQEIVRKFSEKKQKHKVVTVYVYPNEFEDLATRVKTRDLSHLSPEEQAREEYRIHKRLTTATEEIKLMNSFDYHLCIKHNALDEAYQILYSIVIAERAKEKISADYVHRFLRDYAQYNKSRKKG